MLADCHAREPIVARVRPGLVFVTRKFPPSVGGMETLSQHVWDGLAATRGDVVLVAHGGSNRALPVWLPWAVLRVLWLVLVRRAPRVLVGDALAHVVLRPVLRVTGTTDVCMVMGLDVTYAHPLYQALLRRTLPGADRVLAISRATATEVERLGVAPGKVAVVRLGVGAPAVSPAERLAARRELLARLGLAGEPHLIGTVGRLARRKGAAWFVEHVLPGLPGVHHVIAGSGPEREAVEAAAARAGVAARVHLLGGVDDATRELVLRGVEVFVQPNVRVPDDMEGFGLVTIEAALRGTPVLAAALDGILDAVVDGETGDLCAPEDPAAWTGALSGLLADSGALAARGARHAARARELYGAGQMTDAITSELGAV